MNFLKPTYLYLLLFIPLLLLLYVLKLRRKTYVVSSSLLWEQAIEDMKANTLFQRLRRNLLLPLQVIFLSLAVLALARPFWRGAADVAQNIILIVDNSASMRATDVSESRFEAARSTAVKMVDDLSEGDRMMIIEATSVPRVVSGLTSDKLQLRDILGRMKPADTSADLTSAIQLASSVSKDIHRSEIFLLSDGAGTSTRQLASRGKLGHTSAPVRFLKFGSENSDNVGITALEVVQNPADLGASRALGESGGRQVFVALQNFSNVEKRSLLMELYHNGNLIDVQELNLLSGERRSVIFNVPGYNEGIIEVVIDVDDDLDVDDHAYHILSKPDALRVLLVSAGNLFLEEAIRTASARVQLFKKEPAGYSADLGASRALGESGDQAFGKGLIPAEEYDIAVFDSFVPDDLPSRGVIFVNPGTDLPYGKLTSYNDNPTVIDWDRSHPVTRFADLSNLRVDRSYNYEMPVWMKPLVESDMGTLVWLGEHDGQRVIVLPFEVRLGPSSNFPVLAAFPIFVSNALDWLTGIDAESFRGKLRTGEPLKISLPGTDAHQVVTVRKPDGEQVALRPKDGSIVFNDTDRVGIYEVTGEGFAQRFAANLLDESESDIEPADKIEIADQEIVSSATSAASNREIWASLVLAALVILAVEWWVYHRRVLV